MQNLRGVNRGVVERVRLGGTYIWYRGGEPTASVVRNICLGDSTKLPRVGLKLAVTYITELILRESRLLQNLAGYIAL